MYQASTVLTGSEIPALNSSGSCAAADCHPARTRARAVAQMRVAREGPFVRMLLPPSFLYVPCSFDAELSIGVSAIARALRPFYTSEAKRWRPQGVAGRW